MTVRKTKVVAKTQKVIEQKLEKIDTIKRPLYWHTVWLGLRGIGAVAAVPFYLVGLVIRILRAGISNLKFVFAGK